MGSYGNLIWRKFNLGRDDLHDLVGLRPYLSNQTSESLAPFDECGYFALPNHDHSPACLT